MNREETQVRSLLTTLSGSYDLDAGGVVAGVLEHGAVARRRRRRLVVLGAVAAVVVTSLGLVGVQQLASSVPSVDATRHGQVAAPAPAPPPGTRYVGLGRVVVAVPDTWVDPGDGCGAPLTRFVYFGLSYRRGCIIDSGFASQASRLHIFAPGGVDADRVEGYATVPGRVGVLDVRTGASSPNECPAGVYGCRVFYALVVPSERVIFEVMASGEGAAVAQRILDSVRLLPGGYTTVPYVVPGTLNLDAGETIRAAGLQPTDAEGRVSTVPPGQALSRYEVTTTDPVAGTVVAAGTDVRLLPADDADPLSPRARFRTRERLTSCGVVDGYRVDLTRNVDPGVRCLRAAFAAGAGAELEVDDTSFEGGLIVSYYRVLPDGTTERYYDPTRDAFDVGGWIFYSCARPRGAFDFSC